MNVHNATPLAVYKTANLIHLNNSGKPNDPGISILILPKHPTGDRNELRILLVYNKLIFDGFDKWKGEVL